MRAHVSSNDPGLPRKPIIRVLTLVEGYKVAGVPRVVLEFARQACRTDLGLPRVDLAVVTYTRRGVETDFLRALRAERVPLEVLNERHRFDLAALRQLRAAIERRSPDLIWTNSVKSHFLVRAARLNRNLPWVALHHGYTSTDWLNVAYNQLDRWSLRAPDRIATVCHAFRSDLSRRTGLLLGDIDVQHTPIRPLLPVSNDDVANLRRQLGIEAGTRVVLAVGRLSKEKGHADMIRAIDEIRRREPGLPVRALILGEGPEGARLERLCLELNLTANVSLLGFRTDTRAFYALADLLVLPSHSEGSPNVLLEAIAARLLVVATAVGGVPEMVSHEKEALLVPARDVPALALGIVPGLTDGALRDRACLASPDILNRHLPEDYFRSIRSILLNTITTYSESAI